MLLKAGQREIFVFGGYGRKFGGIDPEVFTQHLRSTLQGFKVDFVSVDYSGWGNKQNAHRDSIDGALNYLGNNCQGSPILVGFSIGANLAIALSGLRPVRAVLGYVPPTDLASQIGDRPVSFLDQRGIDLQRSLTVKTRYLLIADRSVTDPRNAHSFRQVARLSHFRTVKIKEVEELKWQGKYFPSSDFKDDLRFIRKHSGWPYLSPAR